MEHAVYAITALRWSGHEIDQAMMGLLDLDRMEWDLAPAPASKSTVIDRLLEGDPVVTLLEGDPRHPTRIGPGLLLGVSDDGAETIAPAESRDDAVLQALPVF